MIEAYPLYWPEGQKRTAPSAIKRNWTFWRGTLDKHQQSLTEEVRKLGGTNLIISTNMKLRRDGGIHAGQGEPPDRGAAVYFNYKKRPMCFACDQFETVRENIRAIALTIFSIRAIERYGASDMMERAFRGFTAIPETNPQSWRDTLGLSHQQKVMPDDVEAAFRLLVKKHHPDVGGTAEEFHRVVLARENALKDLGVTR